MWVAPCILYVCDVKSSLKSVASFTKVLVVRSGKSTYEELTSCLSQLMPFVYVAFFGLAGASLKLVRQADVTMTLLMLCQVA